LREQHEAVRGWPAYRPNDLYFGHMDDISAIVAMLCAMNLQRPFQVVTPTLDGDVLTLLARADRPLTGRGIARVSGVSHGGVQRALEHLVGEGIVDRERAGRAFLYRLNRDHLAARWIEGLASLRLELIERLRETVAAWPVPADAVVLFGSAARSEAGQRSDIDLLLIRPASVDYDDPVWREQVRALESAATMWTGNDTRVLEYAADEIANEEPVLDIAAAEGIELHGSLRRLLHTTRRSRA
jgi:DNA-binding transcriptional ArsR family regulator